MSSLDHAGLAGYLLRVRLETGAARDDGAVALVFDNNMRVLLHPAGRGDLMLEAQVRELPPARPLADEMVMDALRIAARREPAEADCVVLAPEEDRLLLQQRVGAAASADEFEASLRGFLNALTAWRARFGAL